MNFISNQIVTTPMSMEDAVAKAKEAKKTRSLDEILDGFRQGQVKTASSDKETKTAQVADPDQEVETECDETETACGETETACGEVEMAAVVDEDPEVLALDEEAVDYYFSEPEEEPEEEPAVPEKKENPLMASQKGKTLKVAKKHDFRQWEAEDIVKAWKQHGDVRKCMASMKGTVSDPDLYCGLLRIASAEATKVLKSAASKAKEEKVANKAPRFRKVSKLVAKDKAMLREYWAQLYGEEYVNAMLGEYAD